MPMETRRLLFFTMILLSLFFIQNVSASEKPLLKIRYVGKGRFKITRSGHKITVNLRGDFAGCEDMTILHVIDETTKDKKIYVVLLVAAAPRCNPQGMCGAAEDSLTLIWLKLNTSLKLVEKKAVIIDDCVRHISLNDYDIMADNVMALKIVKMEKGILTVEYQDNGYFEDKEKKWRLTYNKNTPEKGFIITPMN